MCNAHNARSFAAEVGKRSSGRIQIDVIGTDIIRDQAEAQKMVKDGKLEMGEFNLAALSELVPSMKALNLPFLFSDSQHMFKLLDGEMAYNLQAAPAASGSLLEAVGDNSTYVRADGLRATVSVHGVVFCGCTVQSGAGAG